MDWRVDVGARQMTIDVSGTIISDKYLLKSLIGSGNLGEVYLAEDLALHRQVAIKIIHLLSHANVAAIPRLLREGQILSQIQHPNIVRVFSLAKTENDDFYLVMEYVDGKTLDQCTDISDWKKSLEICSQVLSAMEYAHRLGYVHRDLKPQNIMISKGKVKVLDFGLASAFLSDSFQKLTLTGTLIGSPSYMSPELCAGRKPDVRSDVYSLGCVLYELLSGKPPFESENIVEVLHQHMHEQPKKLCLGSNPAIPRELERLVFKALEKDPNRRFQSADKFNEAVQHVLKGEDPKIEEPFSVQTLGQKRALVFVLTVFVLLIPTLIFVETVAGHKYGKPVGEALQAKSADKKRVYFSKSAHLLDLASRIRGFVNGKSKNQEIGEQLRSELLELEGKLHDKKDLFIVYAMQANLEEELKMDNLAALKLALKQCIISPGLERAEAAQMHYGIGRYYTLHNRFKEAEPELLIALKENDEVHNNPNAVKNFGLEERFSFFLYTGSLGYDARTMLSSNYVSLGQSEAAKKILREVLAHMAQPAYACETRLSLANITWRTDPAGAASDLRNYLEQLDQFESSRFDPAGGNRVIDAYASVAVWFFQRGLLEDARRAIKAGYNFADKWQVVEMRTAERLRKAAELVSKSDAKDTKLESQ